MVVQIRVEVVDPQVVGAACGHLVLLVFLGRAQRQAARVYRGRPLYLIHVEGWVCGYVIARTLKRMRVVVEAVGLIPAFDVALHAVNRHVHKA